MAAFRIEFPTRPCLVKGKKHLFHCWDYHAWTVGESVLGGGPSGGQFPMVLAVVEDEYGQVHEAYPRDVRFIDDKVKEFFEDQTGIDGQLTMHDIQADASDSM